MTLSHRSWSSLWLLALSAVALLVYGAGLQSKYFGDDFAYYFSPLSSDVFYFFHHNNPGAIIYRPLQSTLFAEVQRRWGMETLPIHLVNLFCHTLLSWLIATMVVRLGYTRLQAMLASAFILLAQINTYAVLSNDTLSQVGGVLFGFLSAYLLFFPGRSFGDEASERGLRPIWFWYLASLVSLAVSLSLKETSTAYLGVVGVALLAANLEQKPRREAILRTALQILPFIALIVLYMIVRSEFVLAQPKFGENRYDLNFGLNIPKNIALFLAASSTAVSSATSFVALQERNLPVLAGVALTIVAFVGLVLAGLWPMRRERTIHVLILLYFFGFLPAILFNRVSEHYIYNSFPFLSALVGIGLGALWMRTASRPRRIAIAVVLSLLAITHVVSIQSKTAWVNHNGEWAEEVLEQLDPFTSAAPRNSTVYLVNPPSTITEYSIYIIKGFDIFEGAFPNVQNYLGRPDLKLVVLEHDQIADSVDATASHMILTLDSERIVRYDGDASVQAIEGVK